MLLIFIDYAYQLQRIQWHKLVWSLTQTLLFRTNKSNIAVLHILFVMINFSLRFTLHLYMTFIASKSGNITSWRIRKIQWWTRWFLLSGVRTWWKNTCYWQFRASFQTCSISVLICQALANRPGFNISNQKGRERAWLRKWIRIFMKSLKVSERKWYVGIGIPDGCAR